MEIYESLFESGIEVLLDDREGRIGARLKDIDLIGIPVKIIIGPKGLKENKVEIKLRAGGDVKLVEKTRALEEIRKILEHGE